ncbi:MULTISPECIES: helix-hairpin-helix domain-containing protein [Gammaproteobacteria]|uniref:ComEA family DNA-binding protein n=1 Tax=Gammaproteobacteria TaxID=1236 RepID=UPI000DD0DF85|nr:MULTISPECIES: helix-hairpin-helix domain-containing protein [Gammaproteobacteria]RTE87289.1 competence protein ComEA [Aliidiomarina sp. B3213]TCZ92925.1 competence protein ComEA [Lysobacter sp. N42]
MFKPIRFLIPILSSVLVFAGPAHAETLQDSAKNSLADLKSQSKQMQEVKQKVSKLTPYVSMHRLRAENDVTETVNINTANAMELAKKLKGVGSTRAQAIIELRERLGGFSDIEQLLEVRGLGVRTLNANRERIVL